MTTLLPRRAASGRRSLARSVASRLLTPHGIDRYTELLDPMLVRDEIRAEVKRVRHQTPDTVTLSLWTTAGFSGFSAGQYVQISVDIDGVRRSRCYSPVNSEHSTPRTLELTIKVHPDGLVSNYLKEHAHAGMVVGLEQADGEFRLPEERPRDLVLVSGGSGITPVLSMLRTLSDEQHTGRVVFLHYNDSPETVPYAAELDEIAEANPSFTVAHGYAKSTEGQVNGLFSTEHLDTVAPWWRDAQTYLCGPPGLMAAVEEAYEAEQLGEQLHTEAFAAPDFSTENADGTVRFAASDVDAENSGKPLLHQAEDAGLTPEHGCRMGICMSCTAIKTSGCVKNTRSGELSTETEEPIQLCVSVPVGDVEIQA